jgi:hypothetical protein
MKNLKDIILEKLKVSNKSSITFDDIEPCDSLTHELFNTISNTLYHKGYWCVNEYYELNNIYEDDLPGLFRSFSFMDEKSKVYGIYGDYESKDPEIRLVFKGHNNEFYSNKYTITTSALLCKTLGKGDINKGLGVLKYIADELK